MLLQTRSSGVSVNSTVGDAPAFASKCFSFFDAGWSSPVARQAHNLKVVSSNLAPATKIKPAVSMR
jgi:hypothetical protein